MNETTKELIKRRIKFCESEVKHAEYNIEEIAESLNHWIMRKKELLKEIQQLKEDLGEETTSQ